MPPGQGLAELRQRKKELLLESDINRQILNLEVCQLRLKASELQDKLRKVQTATTWLAPAAGIAFGVFSMRKRLHADIGNGHRNGRHSRKSTYLKFVTPIALTALRKAYSFWRHSRKRKSAPN